MPQTKEAQKGILPRIRAAWKSFLYGPGDSYGWGGLSYWGGSAGTYGTSIDYTVEAGDLPQNAIIMACIQSIMAVFPEAPVKVQREAGDGSGGKIVPNHALTKILKRPNPYYSGSLLWQATAYSYNLSGDAYWIKVRNARKQVIELWYEPHFTIRARWNEGEFISYYEVRRGNEWFRIERDDVVHFRFGIDPHNPRYGLSKLAAALREVFTDNEAARYSATVLRNTGVPGVVMRPPANETIANPELVKMQFMQKFGGDHRGEPLVVTDPMEIDILSFSPEQMNLKSLRRIPEERICALLGWPAVVAGLGAGLDRSTYNNMDEARQQAYEQNIIPTQQAMADDLTTQLLPDFSTAPDMESVMFDLSKVRVLQDDQLKLYQRLDIGYRGGWLKRAEVRAEVGKPVLPEDDIYFNDMALRPDEEEDGQAEANEDTQDEGATPPPAPSPDKARMNGHHKHIALIEGVVGNG
jgi:HK97 family phage portal protein